MISEVDERNGVVKTYWHLIRNRIAKVEPTFAKIVDELNPDKAFPVYLAYFPYGATEGDTKSIFLPNSSGGYYRLSDPNISKDLITHLGYGKDSSPLGMVLEKNLELFIDLHTERVTIPWIVYNPGEFFPFNRILGRNNKRVYSPNGLLSSTAGARSVFMLPNIGCTTNHSNLQRDFNVQGPPPKSLYDHWCIFKEIVNSDVINSDWRCCIVYFSEKWITKLHNDPAWLPLKLYMHELAWYRFDYKRNQYSYDMIFSMIKKKRNLKPNPYLADTAKHLFTIALGEAAGYIPALDDDALPTQLIQKAFVESYGLKKYLPTIMTPSHFKFETAASPIYYSLQNLSAQVFSPKSREVSSTLSEMRELEYIMRIFIEELSEANSPCADTVIHLVAKNIAFQYYHNKLDRHRTVKSTNEIAKIDKRFNQVNKQYKKSGAVFACDAPFVRGCISISSTVK